MNDRPQGDDRSMSEILSSIRRIVTDEERTRREADEERSRREAEAGSSVFVLTDTMRSDSDEDDHSATLELGAAQAVLPESNEPKTTVDFSAPTLSEEDVEDIVRRVVREELQGPIGQQISRKVKRLIRDEVAAAMADEDDD
ncbi:MAG: hypothetical protein AAF401_07830 [Pseudomonadota bacterium]